MDKLKKLFEEIFSLLWETTQDSNLRTSAIIVTLGVAFLFAVYIYFIYRMCNKSGFYSRNFNRTVAIMSVITAGIVLSMQTSVFVSLGMVGALSIIRFRNVVKEPFDLLFLFWSISTGIICGTGLYRVALILAAVVTVSLFLLEKIPTVKSPLLLIVNSTDPAAEKALMPVVTKLSKSNRVKSRAVTKNGLDMIVEVRTNKETELITECTALPGITSVTLLSHDGELRG